MKKPVGSFILDQFDNYGAKVDSIFVDNFITGAEVAKKWEEQNERNSAVLYRVLYNTFDDVKHEKLGNIEEYSKEELYDLVIKLNNHLNSGLMLRGKS